MVRQGDTITKLYKFQAGVPQGSVLGPILYLLYTADIPIMEENLIGTYADDTAILASHSNPAAASFLLQHNLNMVSKWLKKWHIKANESKSVHVTFSTRHRVCPPVTLNGVEIPMAEEAKYLGIHLDRRLTWRNHIFAIQKQLSHQLRKTYWLIGGKSKLSLENKLLLYKCTIKPTWTYGIQLWGTAANSNTEILQRFQSKIL